MKKLTKILALVLALCLCFTLLVACTDPDPCANGHSYGTDGKCTVCGTLKCDVEGHDFVDGVCTVCKLSPCEASGHSWVNAVCSVCELKYDLRDYVSELKLDMNSNTAKVSGGTEFLLRYVDGDTTHFKVSTTIDEEGTLKARYLAVNTPESTGKIEPYGKVASNFTHEKLSSALANGGKILVESDTDDGQWNHEGYGRMLVWIWYQPKAGADYRNLNLELLQNGLAWGSSSGDNRYGETCLAALNQAIEAKMVIHSGLADPGFYYGEAQEITLKQLRTNLEFYESTKVAFEGTVTLLDSGGCYVEDMDESGVVYGIYIYYGTEKTVKIHEILGTPGNRVRVVGTLSNYYGSWQISGVQYKMSKPNDPGNLQLIETGKQGYYPKMTIAQFFGDTTVSVWDDTAGEDGEGDNVDKTFKMCDLVLNTTISMENLKVVSMYTTNNGGSNDGAISITCKDDSTNQTIVIRTNVLRKADGTLVTQKDFEGKTISVKGIVDYYADQAQYQIKVLQFSDITFVD